MTYTKKPFKQSDITGNVAKLPPQAIELESSVLGACMTSSDAFLDVADFLRPEMFYRETNQKIYSVICHLSMEGAPIDLMSVMAQLKKKGEFEGIGGALYLTELTDFVVNSVNITYNARIIVQKYMQRELINLSSQTISDCFSETSDVFDILDNYETKRDEIVNHVVTKKEVKNEDAAEHFIQELMRKSKLVDLEVTGIDTGFVQMNKNTGGWQDSALILLAARPAMGKTAMMIRFVLSAAKAGKPVLVFSLEMSTEKLMNRMVSIMTGIDLYKINKPSNLQDHDWHQIHTSMEQIRRLPIIWDDSANINMMEISSKCKRLKRKSNIEFVVIDYLQLINPLDKKVVREQQISGISRGLKVLAKELKIPVMALSQLSREVEKRPGNGKRPMLSDLRESGSLEQDADMVMFLYRAEYYDITEDDVGMPTAGKGEVIIAKNRDGEADTINVGWEAEKTRFYDLEVETPIITDFSFLETHKNMDLPNNDLSRFVDYSESSNKQFEDFSDDIANFNNKFMSNESEKSDDEDDFPF